MNYTLTDDELVAAAKSARNTLLKTLPSREELNHDFSFEFEENIEKIRKKIAARKYFKSMTRRVAAFFLAAFLGFSTWMAVDVEAREAVIRWVREVYENSVVYRFFGNESSENPADYEVTWLPGEFEKTEETSEENFCFRYYRGIDGKDIAFYCQRIDSSSANSLVSSGFTIEDVCVNGHSGSIYTSKTEGESNDIVWTDEESNLFFRITAFCDKEDLIRIAESVFIIK